ncbi:MAG: prepilin peptidase [bacterium]|nr:prepilin peptidase [bacterium]
MIINILIIFIFGLVMGSFINVVAERYPSYYFGGRSKCPNCSKMLSWYELIPLVSFFIQNRKCRQCSYKISWRYPIVEFMTGLVFASLYIYIFNFVTWWQFLVLVLASLTLILMASIDARLSILPDGLNIFLAILGAIIIILSGAYWGHILSALGGLLFFGSLAFFSKGRAMGMGDVKLAGAMGLLLGWPQILVAFMTAFIAGGVWGIILMAANIKKMKDAIPFGPFLVIGTLIALFFGPRIFAIIRL